MFGKYSADKKLVKKLLKGDGVAFDRFYEEYFDKLYRFVIARVEYQAHVAEDIVQGSLCKAIDKLSTFRGEASLLTWLCTFCRYEMSAYFKTENKQPCLLEDQPEAFAHVQSFIVAIQEQPENNYLIEELNKIVHLTLDSLPTRYAQAVELKYIQGFSVKDIAMNLDVTPKAVESLLSRARPIFEDTFMTLTAGEKLFNGQQEVNDV